MSIRHTSHARYEIWFHLAFSTKYRKKVFRDPKSKEVVRRIIRATAAHYDMEIGEVNCLSDHIHLTFSIPPRIAPAKAVQILKSQSTRLAFKHLPYLTQHYWGGEIWTAGYFIRSVGSGTTKEEIEKYVREQSEEY